MASPPTFEARLRHVLRIALGRRAHLVDKAISDPARFLADSRSPSIRRLGAAVSTLGLFPAVNALEGQSPGPRHIPFGHRDRGADDARSPVTQGALLDVAGNRLRGFAFTGGSLAALVVHVDDVEVGRFFAAQAADASAGSPPGRCAFDVCVDLSGGGAREGANATLRITCAVSGRALDGSPRGIRIPRYVGAVRQASRGRIAGFVADSETRCPVFVDVLADDRQVARLEVGGGRHARLASLERWRSAFVASYVPRRDEETFVVRVRGTERPLFGTPRRFDDAETIAPPSRDTATLEAMRTRRHGASGCVLMITHHLGGGVAVHIDALAQGLETEGMLVLELRSHDDGTLRLRTSDATLEASFVLEPETETGLLACLRALEVTHVHLHAWLTLPAFVLHIADTLGVPFDVTLHDYFAACPRVNFVRADGTYCGEPDVRACETCMTVDGPLESVRFFETSPLTTVRAHRASHADLLSRARRVLAPSADTAARSQRALGARPIDAMPPPEKAAMVRFSVSPPSEPVRVAVLGGIMLHKGYRVLLDIARHANAHALPLRFVVFGTTTDSGALRRLPNIEVTGKYERAELPARLERAGCTVAAFLSVCPETYSYTLSEALTLGLYPVCFDIGAPAERIRAFGHGRVLAMDTTAGAICEALIEAGRAPKPEEALEAPFTDYASILRDYYALTA
jgi:glycosyltransferase involved in cell wall biosynthesis